MIRDIKEARAEREKEAEEKKIKRKKERGGTACGFSLWFFSLMTVQCLLFFNLILFYLFHLTFITFI